jgi:protoporphyrinogen oxidase
MVSGKEKQFDYLISTLPIPLLYRMLTDTPDELKHAASRLNALSVLNINLGIERPQISDQHWIYFPENEYVFSRVGFPMNFSDTLTPKNTSSMYIEITHRRGDKLNGDALFERSITDLRKCGILRDDDRILTRHVIDIDFGYVVFDEHRQTHLQTLIDYLASVNIYTAGRYGRWDYFSMEDSILSGKTAAEQILAAV